MLFQTSSLGKILIGSLNRYSSIEGQKQTYQKHDSQIHKGYY